MYSIEYKILEPRIIWEGFHKYIIERKIWVIWATFKSLKKSIGVIIFRSCENYQLLQIAMWCVWMKSGNFSHLASVVCSFALLYSTRFPANCTDYLQWYFIRKLGIFRSFFSIIFAKLCAIYVGLMLHLTLCYYNKAW